MTGMPRSLFDREAIEAEIGRVRSLDLDELRTLWRVTFRSSPSSAFTKDLMARFLCWHGFDDLLDHVAEHSIGRTESDLVLGLDSQPWRAPR